MDELTPEWLNNDFLRDSLQNESRNKNLIVTDFKVESAVPPGNNYGSVVVRVKINYEDKARSHTDTLSKTLIVKLPLTKGLVKDTFMDTPDTEPIFYNYYLPKAYELLKHEFAPKSYSSSIKEVVVLEDLKEGGFRMADRQKNLDFLHCQLYAQAAAAFHAGSVAVCKKHPEIAAKSRSPERLFSNEAKAAVPTKNLIRYGLDSMAYHVLQTTGNERISSIIKGCSTILWDLMVECVKPNGDFNTFNQGDPWITNMMFQYDENDQCVGIKLLDFQCIRYASPATDLTFFIWTSGKHYVREEKFEEYIQTYVEAMNHHLEEMELPERLSLDLLRKDILRMSPLALQTCSSYLPFLHLPVVPDIVGIFSQCEQDYNPDNNPLEKYYTEDFCKTHMVRLVKQMEKLNVFEYLETCLAKQERGN